MKERPIPFSGEMVRAILEGRKTQTRRVIKPQPSGAGLVFSGPSDGYWVTKGQTFLGDPLWRCPYGIPGDRLWVRETWAVHSTRNKTRPSELPQTLPIAYKTDDFNYSQFMWRSPRFMPRWASRITLEVTDVRAERVQDISEDDAGAEGVEAWHSPYPKIEQHNRPGGSYRNGFHELWDSINAKRGFGWDVNPWVWVIEFSVQEREKRIERREP